MIFSVKEIVKITNGTLLQGDVNSQIQSVQIDSRSMDKASLFVPLKGERSDGHDYIFQAFENGAVAVFSEKKLEYVDKSKSIILVENSLKALQELAQQYIKHFDLEVIGVTGSVGKTSTKEMISYALSGEKKVFKTEKNFNSDIGLPLTIFKIDSTYDIAVLEMAVGEIGELERTAKIARPHQAVMTNIGISHIEKLKSQENILKEKLHITDYFDKESILFVNGDDPLLSGVSSQGKFRVVTFGLKEENDFFAYDITVCDMMTSFSVKLDDKEERFTIPVVGNHNVYNALAAIAVAWNNGIAIESVRKNILGYKNQGMRQEIHKVGFTTIIDDCYNASPDSMKSGINVLRAISGDDESIAVLADMLELGEQSVSAHEEVGRYVAENYINELVTIGELGKIISDTAARISDKIKVKHFSSNEDVIAYLKSKLPKKRTVLVKASRGMKLDEVVKTLCKVSS